MELVWVLRVPTVELYTKLLGFISALMHLLNVWQVVSGKYVMIVDVIVDEQEGLNTVLMVCHPVMFVCMMLSGLREREFS